jgi:hypothetical protein
MADESMQADPAEESEEQLTPETEIAVRLDSLEADGTRPSVGDSVTVKVDATVKKIENDYAYVQADAINDTDINEIVADTQQSEDDEDSMMARMTAQADQANMGGQSGGGYG